MIFSGNLRKMKTENRNYKLEELRQSLLKRNDPEKINEPFFQIYPFYHEKDHYLRDYKEKRFIIK